MRIIYTMLDLNKRGRDIRAYIHMLEQWIINSLAQLGLQAYRIDGKIGLWVNKEHASPEKAMKHFKIAAIGIRLKSWISFHGVSVNIAPELKYFSGIVPCGISDNRFSVTSLKDMYIACTMSEFDDILKKEFVKLFD